VRGDLLSDIDASKEKPIPHQPPTSQTPSSKSPPQPIEDIGEPPTACFLTKVPANVQDWYPYPLLLTTATAVCFIVVYTYIIPYRWMFEKYDGIRAFWNPVKQSFYSRFGRKLDIPQYIVDTMPTHMFLDGEIW